ncbi:hypothetical protein rsdtw13_16250 [Clostridium sp. TW13]|uniref:Uncharacterized protein n=1 Tax=Inconstantimicrobium mannanitabidum TaxID=1604901 RepID=A0ACB5RAZ8_9CLOT|nr:hypothetical protein rsdtw13_16250 [Clostridium sp. TW13]
MGLTNSKWTLREGQYNAQVAIVVYGFTYNLFIFKDFRMAITINISVNSD